MLIKDLGEAVRRGPNIYKEASSERKTPREDGDESNAHSSRRAAAALHLPQTFH